MKTLNTVKLRNGSEESKSLVKVMLMSLRSLMESNPLAFYDLVSKCRDSSYEFFGDNKEALVNLALVEAQGTVHESVKNIVLSAIVGENLDIELQSPVED